MLLLVCVYVGSMLSCLAGSLREWGWGGWCGVWGGGGGFFVQAEDGIRDLVRSRGLGDVYKRQTIRLSRPTMMRLSPTRSIASVKAQ